ncbi:MAG: pseudaminic acid cytidylyltransferase [Halothiobacillaceae bacterium]|nr:pseudaminic acid cytidylyltransferase [Halothiobacillaceae bacterium]
MRLAVIPARGGSKRIPRKNIKPFHGKPMIAWSIAAALDSGCFDEVIVSTDDHEIATVAVEHGARVPFIRPAELADDYTPTIPVIAHAINWFEQQNQPPLAVCCIYATAPFLRAGDIRTGLDVLCETGAPYTFAATSYAFPIQRALKRLPDGRMAMFYPEQFATRSQDLEEAFHDAGQFYWGKAAAWLAAKPIFDGSAAVFLPRHRVQDIDTSEDWSRAEWLFSAMQAELSA